MGNLSPHGNPQGPPPPGGLPLAVRSARALAAVAEPVLAVGREAGTGLETILDAGRGPLVADGAEAIGELLEAIDSVRIPPERWSAVAPPHALLDVDTRADLDRAGRLAKGPPG